MLRRLAKVQNVVLGELKVISSLVSIGELTDYAPTQNEINFD